MRIQRTLFWLLVAMGLLVAPMDGASPTSAFADDATHIELEVRCGRYRGLWRINGAQAAKRYCSREPVTRVRLQKGMTYDVDLGYQRNQARLAVGRNGTVTITPAVLATISGQTMTWNTVPLRVHAGAYLGAWRAWGMASRQDDSAGSWPEHPLQTVYVLPGVRVPFVVALLKSNPHSMFVSVSAQGVPTVTPATAPARVERLHGCSTVILSTVRVVVRASRSLTWAINGGSSAFRGDGTTYLVPGMTYRFEDRVLKRTIGEVAVPFADAKGMTRVTTLNAGDGQQLEVNVFR